MATIAAATLPPDIAAAIVNPVAYGQVESVELAGTPQRAPSTFVGGPKTLPIKFVAR